MAKACVYTYAVSVVALTASVNSVKINIYVYFATKCRKQYEKKEVR